MTQNPFPATPHVEPHGQSPWHPGTTPHVGRHPAHALDEPARAHGQRPWPDGGVERLLDLPALLRKKSHLLLGPRQTGKSYLIRHTLKGTKVYNRFFRLSS